MDSPVSLMVDPDRCTACRACELACHYHHTGTFGTAQRSVSILYQPDTSELSIVFDDTCDHCVQETMPLCAKFCGPGAIEVR